MYSLNPSIHTPDQAELSRHAAERYALLSAVRQRRAARRGAARGARATQPLPPRPAIDALAEGPRC